MFVKANNLNEKEEIGRVGERYVQYLLELHHGIETKRDNVVYDLRAWFTNQRIEIKTASERPNISYGKQRDTIYHFSYSDSQTKKDAFDFTVCLGYKDIETLREKGTFDNIYVIPQKYIHSKPSNRDESKEWHKTLAISPNPLKSKYNLKGWSYDRFEMCKGLDKLSILATTNKRKVSNHIYRITNKLLNFEEDKRNNYKKQLLKLWNKGYTTNQIYKEMEVNRKFVYTLKQELGLPAYNPKCKTYPKNIRAGWPKRGTHDA